MNHSMVALFSFSVCIGACIGWVKYKMIDSRFLPFIICLTVAAVNEILSYKLSQYRFSTAYNNNIYVLIEAMLITWQFNNWGQFKNQKLFILLLAIITAAWIVENTILYPLSHISVYFRIGYSYIIVMMSVNTTISLMLTVKTSLLKNATFLLCMGFIIFFTNKILFETFWLYGLAKSSQFRNNLYLVLTWINLIVNLIYAAAVLWIPKKRQFIRPS